MPAAEALIAVVATEDSPHQPHGNAIIPGAEAAVARINAAGGVNGAYLGLRVWREDCSRTRAAEVAREIALVAPALVIGHLCATATAAAASVYAERGVLFITASRQANAALPAAGRFIFRLNGREDRLAGDMVRFVASHYPGAGVALVADRTLQARKLAAAIEHEMVAQKIPIALTERIESSEKSYTQLANRVRDSGAGVVLMPAQPVELAVIAADLRRAGVAAPIVGSDILAVPDISDIARRTDNGLVLMLPWTGLEARRSEDEKPSELADLSASSSDAVMSRATAAVEAWAQAALVAGTTEPEAVGQALIRHTATTTAGRLGFDAAGDARIPSYLPYAWAGGWKPVPR